MNDLYFAAGEFDDTPLDATTLERLRRSEKARFLVVRRGRVLALSEAGRIDWKTASEVRALGLDPAEAVFLAHTNGRALFAAIPPEAPLTAKDRFAPGARDCDGYVSLYHAAAAMPPAEALLAARAVHFFNWINRSRYCGICAAETRADDGGRKRICANGHEEFPRTDPVVIVLVVRGDRCLLGRQPRFPPRRYSAVAGFVQPGETLEAAVRREVYEETGLGVGRIAYRASQAWPFPTSLMLGFIAATDDERVTLYDGELEDARWFARDDVAVWAREPEAAPVALPPRGVMARRLIEDWLAGCGAG